VAEALSSRSGRVARTERVWTRRGEFGVILLGASSAVPVTLAGTGIDVWDALDRPRNVEEVVTDVSNRFGVSTETVRSDVLALVDALGSAGLLELR
jgi:Coenzyme PQQ synthesis protein D (PqqD)